MSPNPQIIVSKTFIVFGKRLFQRVFWVRILLRSFGAFPFLIVIENGPAEPSRSFPGSLTRVLEKYFFLADVAQHIARHVPGTCQAFARPSAMHLLAYRTRTSNKALVSEPENRVWDFLGFAGHV